MLIDIIAGARPNFVKIAPIIHALRSGQSRLRYRLVHTGQHYDAKLSHDFFVQLNIPEPDVNLGAGSGTQAEQTAAIMVRYENLLRSQPSRLCLVVGDVTSTMACAIVAQKAGIPVGHVEGGIRSHDWSMPEEINRLVTDAITNWFFTTSRVANDNLLKAGVGADRIVFVGNTMIDSLLANRHRFQPPAFWQTLDLQPGGYLVLTLHRPSNVDDVSTLSALLHAVGTSAPDKVIVFPVHPRTRQILVRISGLPANIHVVDPQPYLEFNYLVEHALGVITDSGGVTEETTVLGIPCITVRDSTERPETVSEGTNELVGNDLQRLREAIGIIMRGEWKRGGIPELWDGKAAQRIVAALQTLVV
ncbi:non-hydrolyzing UDP-N-acetylglucosamine 2-epimerase [Bordetella petrii]|uniref:UDP-N-acetylglucosamine 2-epimerase n=1 Tax=Bordetella petrii (strain ATCC BAA-461 / DSM 12804 / CCUG 43448 / CIP 107267 / Se-1111R) TaxID=340100 RepID=A9IHB8_BORPD|nr:UDP-N-acetylglucosamine 2-epimerase (non-hydrolyzing) [Bordetella petrii]CAP45183.1 Putative UDP-N-acetylglucosamine 2-epimerase [Bordetella petrii]